MTTIYKYDLEDKSPQTIELPANAVVLTANDKHGSNLKLWALVDTDEVSERRTISIYGTGHALSSEILNTSHYVNTIFRGSLVWHVFINRV